MVSFWDAMTDTSKKNWKKIAADIKGVELVVPKEELESLDEIAELMAVAPGFLKEET